MAKSRGIQDGAKEKIKKGKNKEEPEYESSSSSSSSNDERKTMVVKQTQQTTITTTTAPRRRRRRPLKLGPIRQHLPTEVCHHVQKLIRGHRLTSSQDISKHTFILAKEFASAISACQQGVCL